MSVLRTLVVFFLFAWSSANVFAGGNAEDDLEPIVLELLEKNIVIFRARSHGCTSPEDFRVLVDGRDFSIRRIKEDRCRRMPYWDRFTLPLSLDVNETQVYLLNPLVLQPN